MIFYHFTAREYVHAIAREGLRKGEVALSPTGVLTAVWLTTDPDPAGHGLTEERKLTVREKGSTLPAHSDVSFPNKRAIRFRTDVDPSDEKLVHWPEWGKPRLDPAWYRTLHLTGGGKSEHVVALLGHDPGRRPRGDRPGDGPALGRLARRLSPVRPTLIGASVIGAAPIPAAGAVGWRTSWRCGVGTRPGRSEDRDRREVALTTP